MITNLIRVVSAPARIVDALVVKPVADLAEEIAEGIEEVTR